MEDHFKREKKNSARVTSFMKVFPFSLNKTPLDKSNMCLFHLYSIKTSRKHAYIMLTPLNPTFE